MTEAGVVRLVVAITGASGAAYGIEALRQLRALDQVETHLVLTKGARSTIAFETGTTIPEIHDLADVVHRNDDLAAPLSSGSFRTAGMLVAPCSIKTLSSIATCHAGNLVARAADVSLKERRRLVMMVRETPLHAGHLRLLSEATTAGAIIAPPVPAMYALPRTIADLVEHTVGRALDLFDLDAGAVSRWQGATAAARTAPARAARNEPPLTS